MIIPSIYFQDKKMMSSQEVSKEQLTIKDLGIEMITSASGKEVAKRLLPKELPIYPPSLLRPMKDHRYVLPNIFIEPYKKSKINFKSAFSKEDVENLEPKRSLPTRISFFMTGILYAIPIVNTIIYLFANIFLKEKVMSYDEVIYLSNTLFKHRMDGKNMIEYIKENLKACKYKEDVENGKNPSFHVIDDDLKIAPRTHEENQKILAEEFVRSLPRMKVYMYLVPRNWNPNREEMDKKEKKRLEKEEKLNEN